MGTGTVTSAVADAGPIIHLSEIDALQFLHVFDHLLIPNEVWNETVGKLGILIRAYRKRLISLEDAKNRLMRLQKQSSLFVTPTIIELAIAEIDRKA